MTEPANESLEVAAAEAGRRLDVFLAERLRVSRGAVRRLLAAGAVRVSGRALGEGDKGLALRAGERVEVAAAARADAERIAAEPDAALCVLARGPGWLAVDKPAGMPVHPLGAGERGTLLSAVAARHPEIQGIGEGGLRSGVVHRLDVDTSGAMLLATDAAQWQRLRAAFSEHRVDKRYRAIALGHVAADGEIELSLAIARHRPAFVRAAQPGDADARRTVTRWRVRRGFARRDAARGAHGDRLPAPGARHARASRPPARGRPPLRAATERRRRDRRRAPHAARGIARVRGDLGREPRSARFRRGDRAAAEQLTYFLRANVSPSEIGNITLSTRRSAQT